MQTYELSPTEVEFILDCIACMGAAAMRQPPNPGLVQRALSKIPDTFSAVVSKLDAAQWKLAVEESNVPN